jgi:hypothetical protein
VGTANVGSRAPTYPPFIVALREKGPTAIPDRRPRSARGSNQFPDSKIWRSHSRRPMERGDGWRGRLSLARGGGELQNEG